MQPGCFWALAAGWAILTWAVPETGVLAREKFWLNVAFVVAIVLGAIYATIERKVIGDSALVIDALPEPEHGFRGKIETTLKKEPAPGYKLRLEVGRRGKRSSSTIWQSEAFAHPIRGEKGLILPVEFSIPAGIDVANSGWSLVVRAWTFPMPYLATFVLPQTPPEQ
jgi:hypothetical protein